MLGPSIFFTSVPVGAIYAGRAIRRAPDRGFAWGGFIMALVGAAFLTLTFVVMIFGPSFGD